MPAAEVAGRGQEHRRHCAVFQRDNQRPQSEGPVQGGARVVHSGPGAAAGETDRTELPTAVCPRPGYLNLQLFAPVATVRAGARVLAPPQVAVTAAALLCCSQLSR